MSSPVHDAITGTSASEIADSVRELIDRGDLAAGDLLPSVRALGVRLGVNRNTVVAAYQLLARNGSVVGQGRAGTRVARTGAGPRDGYTDATGLRDLASGNPAPDLIPDLSAALRDVVGRPVLYGAPAMDPEVEAWAREWVAPDVPPEFEVAVAAGAVDAIERLLAQALTRDDAVALEDPCFLASIQTARVAGYRTLPVEVDGEGMTPEGLRLALEQGARAVVCTPRAQNPTGASFSDERARELRAVLEPYPYVLVIEDDYYSLLSRQPFRSIVGPGHRRWALVRSVSKFVGPDMCLALLASDRETASRLALRLGPGTTRVSHLLQRLTHALLTDEDVCASIETAAEHYAGRNAAFTALLRERDWDGPDTDGISVWLNLARPAGDVARDLATRGWLARTGDEFSLAGEAPSHHLRLTVHDLDDDELTRLADDLGDAGAFAP